MSGAAAKPLADDLKEVSLVAGLFSTAICEAAKLGYPVIFLNETGWFYTPDLADFGAVTMNLVQFTKACPEILGNPETWARNRKASTHSAERYYLSQRNGLRSVAQDVSRQFRKPQLAKSPNQGTEPHFW